MDLTRAVGYRGFALNSIEHEADSSNLSGCEIVTAEYGAVPGVGYDEKRSMYDGHDASDVYLGKRIVSLSGVLYGLNRGAAFSEYLRLSDVLTPTEAYQEDVSNKGFWPLDFYIPTQATVLHVMLLARPAATPQFSWNSDRSGGVDTEPLAIPWQARLDCRDPRLYSFDLASHALSGTNGGFTGSNAGNRFTSIRITLIANAQGTFVLQFGGVTVFTITVLAGTITYDSAGKVLTYGSALRMDLLNAANTQGGAVLPPGNTAVTWTCTVSLLAGSKIEYRSAWA